MQEVRDLVKCHDDNPFMKFLNSCNDTKIALDMCFRVSGQMLMHPFSFLRRSSLFFATAVSSDAAMLHQIAGGEETESEVKQAGASYVPLKTCNIGFDRRS
jgi:hypothetical protein